MMMMRRMAIVLLAINLGCDLRRGALRSVKQLRALPRSLSPPPPVIALLVTGQLLLRDGAEIAHAVRRDRLVADRIDVITHEDAAANVDITPPSIGLRLVVRA